MTGKKSHFESRLKLNDTNSHKLKVKYADIGHFSINSRVNSLFVLERRARCVIFCIHFFLLFIKIQNEK